MEPPHCRLCWFVLKTADSFTNIVDFNRNSTKSVVQTTTRRKKMMCLILAPHFIHLPDLTLPWVSLQTAHRIPWLPWGNIKNEIHFRKNGICFNIGPHYFRYRRKIEPSWWYMEFPGLYCATTAATDADGVGMWQLQHNSFIRESQGCSLWHCSRGILIYEKKITRIHVALCTGSCLWARARRLQSSLVVFVDAETVRQWNSYYYSMIHQIKEILVVLRKRLAGIGSTICPRIWSKNAIAVGLFTSLGQCIISPWCKIQRKVRIWYTRIQDKRFILKIVTSSMPY